MKNIGSRQKSLYPKSLTPIHGKYKDFNLSQLNNSRTIKSVRKVSLSPLHFSSRQSSNDTPINPRAFSDGLNSLYIQQDPILQKLNTVIYNVQANGKSYKKNLPSVEKIKHFSEVLDAVFTMFNCERGRIGAFNLAQLFVSLGLSEDCETLVEMFRNISEGQPLNMISYSKQELLKLCEDSKTEIVLQSILRELKVKPTNDKSISLHYLIDVIKKWFKRLDKFHNNQASFEDISKHYSEIGIIENSSDAKRVFLRIGHHGNYLQFKSIFGKSLLKHLFCELSKIVKKGEEVCLSAEVAICIQRRKVILKSLEGHSRILDEIIECNVYNT